MNSLLTKIYGFLSRVCCLLFTARIRRMGEGNIFSLFSLAGGTPSQVWVGGYPISGLGRGGTPSQVWVGGYPVQGLGRGGTPSQVGGGIPHLRSEGTPSQVGGVPPSQVGGTPSQVRRGYPRTRSGVWGVTPGTPPTKTWDGVHPPPPLHRRTFLC